MSTIKKVIHLHERDPREALERLNRITGLEFAYWPESLVPVPAEDDTEGLDRLADTGTEPTGKR